MDSSLSKKKIKRMSVRAHESVRGGLRSRDLLFRSGSYHFAGLIQRF